LTEKKERRKQIKFILGIIIVRKGVRGEKVGLRGMCRKLEGPKKTLTCRYFVSERDLRGT